MGTPERDQLPCRECGTLFTKRMVEQRHCTNADRGHPELYRGDDSGCFEKTDRGQRALAAQERRERRKKRKADRLWRQRKKVETALARVDQARRQLVELEAAGEGGPDRRTRGQSGPAKNVQGPDGKFVRTTPPRQPQEKRKKRKAWFKCRIGRCVGSMKHPCSGCRGHTPENASESPQNGSEKATTQTPSQERGSQPPGGDRDRDQVVLRLVAEAKADREDAAQGGGEDEEETEEPHVTACPRDPAEAQSVLDRLGRESRTGAPPPGGDRDQAVLRFVAEAKEAREKQDDEESLIETTSNPLLED